MMNTSTVVRFPPNYHIAEKSKPSKVAKMKALLAATTHHLELDIADTSNSSELQQRIVNEISLIKKLAHKYASHPMVLIPTLPSPSMRSAALLAITPTFNEQKYVSSAPPRKYLKLNPNLDATASAPRSSTIPCAPFVLGVVGAPLISRSTAQFVAVYRGIDAAQNVFVCLSEEDVSAFNAIAKRLGTPQSRCWGEQMFASTLRIRKQHNGWKHGSALFPFNAVCVFHFDFARNAIVAMKAMETDGAVQSVGQCGSVWIHSAVQVDAEEQRCERDSLTKCGKVTSVAFALRGLRELERSGFGAYLMHDYDANDGSWSAGMRLKICLKLSTKTNRKHEGKSRRPIWVQAWNVRKA